jgi:hypothetical protein
MSNQQSILSASQPDKSKQLAAIKELLRKAVIFDDNVLPAQILQYDRESNLATIKPLIAWVGTDDKLHSRHEIDNVPVISLGAGGFHINFPIKAGDLGWIYASDRDISQFKETLAESQPNSGRLHTFEDCMFIPDVFRQYVIHAEDADAMVIQSTDSATRISIRGDNIKITTPSKITLDTPLTDITGNVNIQQNLTVLGISTLKNTTVNDINVSSHGHQETNSGRTAGGMVS